MAPDIKVVMLDVGGVVLPVNWLNALRILQTTQLEVDHQKLLKFISHSSEYDLFERGDLSEEQFLIFLQNQLNWQSDRAELIELWNSCLQEAFPALEETLANVAKTHRLATLSNTNPLHFSAFSKMRIFQHFHFLLTSINLRSRKPEPIIYQKAAKTIGVLPSQILFIDDLQVNIDAARSQGLYAEQSANSPERVLEILRQYQIC